MTDPVSEPEAGRAARRMPAWVLGVALLAALLHMAPYWLQQSSTPAGWSFTGNTTISPDLMQYRVWMRQAPAEGIVVFNKLTAEENRPHLPVLFYYGLGRVSNATGIRPEVLYAYSGALLSIVLVILIFLAARTFLADMRAVRWAFFMILVGGGLGGYLKLASLLPRQLQPGVLRKLFLEPTNVAPVLEDYRQHYVFRVLFDTHFLVIWIGATLSVLALYGCFRRPSVVRAAATATAFALTTFLHVYTGVTLLAISVAGGAVCWREVLGRRGAWLGPAAGISGAVLVLAVLLFLQRHSGLPYPSWKEMPLPIATLLLGYPVAVWWLSRGFARYWSERDIKDAFLVAWVAGCLAVVLAWPFNPYPSRGTITLQIGLYLLAASVYFSRRASVRPWEVALIVLFLAGTPSWTLVNIWRNHAFRSDAPYTWQSEEHLAVVRALRETGMPGDLLLASPREELWLAPEFPGRHQVAHFFLTVDYERKLGEFEDFLEALDAERWRFLDERGVRFLFVSTHDGSRRFLDVPVVQDPESFLQVQDLEPLVETSVGTLFEFRSPERATRSPGSR